jgi:hypothetical protein
MREKPLGDLASRSDFESVECDSNPIQRNPTATRELSRIIPLAIFKKIKL